MTSPTVLLTGTASSHNKGDATMQHVVSTELRKELGEDARIVIASPSAPRDKDFYDAEVVFSHRRSPSLLLNLAAAGAWRAINLVTRATPDFLLHNDELKATRDADLVVDLSGDMLTEDYGFVVGFSHFVPLIQAHWLRTPYVICAQSIGPFAKLKPFAIWLLRRSAAITIREDVTRDRVAGLGLDMETTADVAFLLDPDRETADALLAEAGVNAEHLIGLSVSPILKTRYESAHEGESFAQAIATAVDDAFEGEDVHVVFIPHVTGPHERHDDRIVAREVAQHLRTPHTLLEHDVRPAVLKGVVARCEMVLGARMHANMAALSQAVPLLALSYSHKTQGIMEMFGQGDMIVDGKKISVAELTDKIRTLGGQLAERSAAIRAKHPEVIARSRSNIDRLMGLIRK